jgi:hypothetical protein
MVKERKTIPCMWCGEPTPMLGTKKCDKHWELQHRIESEPEMALRMLIPALLLPLVREAVCDTIEETRVLEHDA